MRAVTIRAFGDPDGMEVVDRPAPTPGDGSWIGRRVWAFTGTGGGYVEEAVARTDDIVALPAGLSPVDAVTLGSAAPVAYFGLERARLRAGETVLVRGAAGSTGIAAAVCGDLHAVVHDVLPLDAAADAHRRLDAGEVFGRIVLVP
ncbi:MAG TPA: hypothetical protein VGG75_12090 [Trebonia sp.]|jgi:NADPH:quinone reductase-like Zn-dependent oxidoreductase